MNIPAFPLECADADRIKAFLDLHAPPTRADLAFVFGTRLQKPAQLAAALFNTDKVKYVVLTGGVNHHTGLIESVEHKKLLMSSGVPESCIILEQRSTNTGENVVFALPEIEARVGMSNLTSVIVVTKWYHSRRAAMTLKRHLEQGIRYFSDSYESDQSRRSDWHMSETSARPVIKEWQSIPEYLQRGWISEVIRANGCFV